MNEDLSSTAFDELDLATIKVDSTTAPKERLTDPNKLRSIHMRFREDDRVNAYNRAMCQSLLDGEPPYDQEELNNANQPDTTNLNFQGAEKKLERAKAPYYRLVNSGELLLNVRTNYGPEDQRSDWQNIMDEEISRTIRACDEFPYETDRLIHKFVWEGVGIAHWQDDRDWRFRASGFGQFYYPRQVAATEAKQEIVTAEDEFTITDLWSKINREDAEGWDKASCRLAITKATSAEPEYQNWERLMEEVKNNDLYVGTRLPKIKVIQGFVKEFDGKVSHYITTENSCGEKTFLFKSLGCYANMTEVMILFPYGTGTNTKLHGIRGLGYKLYPFEQQLNRSVCRLIDQGEMSSSLMLQGTTESDYANLGLEYIGNLAALPPGFNVVPLQMPDLQRSVIPAIDMMTQLGNDRTSGYSAENVFDGDQRKTKFEVTAALEQSAELSTAALDFFYTPADRMIQQIIRRMTRKDYLAQDPGGEEVIDLRLRLAKRGVPLEAFYRIDWKRTTFVRIIGAGSSAAKTLGLQRMAELSPYMDDVGKLYLHRELGIDAVGRSQIDKFFPQNGQVRTTVDTQIAILQNAQLLQGLPIPVLSSDLHLAHAREHMKPLLEMYEAAQAGQIPLGEAATSNIELFSHTVEHVQRIEGDIAASEEAGAMRQMLQRIEEIISNGLKEAEAANQEAAQAEAEGVTMEADPNATQGEPPLSQEQQERFNKAQAEIELMRLKSQAGIEMEMQRNQARIQMDDAKTAAEIRRKNLMQSAGG